MVAEPGRRPAAAAGRRGGGPAAATLLAALGIEVLGIDISHRFVDPRRPPFGAAPARGDALGDGLRRRVRRGHLPVSGRLRPSWARGPTSRCSPASHRPGPAGAARSRPSRRTSRSARPMLPSSTPPSATATETTEVRDEEGRPETVAAPHHVLHAPGAGPPRRAGRARRRCGGAWSPAPTAATCRPPRARSSSSSLPEQPQALNRGR